jgi:hypothetical protein
VQRILRAAGIAALLGALGGCLDTPAAFGTRANADSLYIALSERFTNVERDPRFAAARIKLIHHALAPSRVFDDTAVWNGAEAPAGDVASADPPAVRTLVIRGAFENGRYRLFDDPTAGLPTRVGDTQQLIRLERTGKGEFEWTTRAVGAVGSITGDDLARVTSALIAAGATKTEAQLRNDYRSAFPRTTAALGRLFTLDTLRTVPASDGTSAITLIATVHPDALQATYPAFAKYLRKYVGPTRIHSTLADKSGASWMDIKWENGALTIACRGTKEGHLAPMSGGGNRTMPDTLVLNTDLSTKIAIFAVGMSDLVADVTVTHTPHERGWNFAFRREPKYHLPLAIGHFMKASLKRPFENQGSSVRLALQDSSGAESLLFRDGHLALKESTIVKWMGGLGKAAVGDFAGQSEAEENRFDVETFTALRADIDALRN